MRVIVTAIGVAGDLLPLLGVAQALRGRGHEVVAVLDEPWRSRAAAAGFAVADLGPVPPLDTERLPSLARPMEGSLAFLCRVVAPRVETMNAALESAARAHRADLILGHHISLGAPWVAERLGIGWAMAAVAPASWTSLEEVTVYPGMPDRDRYSPRMMRFAVAAGKTVTNLFVDRAVRRAARAAGLSRVRSVMFEGQFSGIINLGLWSPRFRGLASDDAPRSSICGFVTPPSIMATSTAAERVVCFAEAGDPVIVFTLGTSVPHAARDFFKSAVEWCARAGARGVLLTGREEYIPTGLPPHVAACAFAPLDTVLRNARAIVHHAGLGSIASAIRSGVPMVNIPHLHDQFDNAARCRRMGIGVTVHRRRLARIAPALDRVLGDARFAQAIARERAGIASEDGAARAAQAIEAAMGGVVSSVTGTPAAR